MAVNKACYDILETVNKSNLDYKMNQTPYSLHFSIRKKFTKSSTETPPTDFTSLLNPQPEVSEKYDDRLRQELLNTRNEYVKLYNFYIAEIEAKNKFESEFLVLLDKFEAKEKHEKDLKSLEAENKKLKEKVGVKSLELKQQKDQIDELKKENNTFSVALKASKKEKLKAIKDFEKDKKRLEEKLNKLNEF